MGLFFGLSTSGSAGDHLARGGRGPSQQKNKRTQKTDAHTNKQTSKQTNKHTHTQTNKNNKKTNKSEQKLKKQQNQAKQQNKTKPSTGQCRKVQAVGGRFSTGRCRKAQAVGNGPVKDRSDGHSPQREGAERCLPAEVYYDQGHDLRRASAARRRLSGVSSRRAGAARRRLSGTNVT